MSYISDRKLVSAQVGARRCLALGNANCDLRDSGYSLPVGRAGMTVFTVPIWNLGEK